MMWSSLIGPGRAGGLSAVDARIRGVTLCDYFSAADDQAAVAVLQTPGRPDPAALDVVCLKNIDPVVCMARLEATATAARRVGCRCSRGRRTEPRQA